MINENDPVYNTELLDAGSGEGKRNEYFGMTVKQVAHGHTPDKYDQNVNLLVLSFRLLIVFCILGVIYFGIYY